MSDEKATARPWELGSKVFHQGVDCREVSSPAAGGKWGGGYIGAFAEADAELIVTAVNERDELVAEVGRLKAWVRNILDSGVEFEDPRLSYKTMQIEKRDLEEGLELIGVKQGK
jgi:hypothetical protein